MAEPVMFLQRTWVWLLIPTLGGSQPSGSQASETLTLSLAFPGYLFALAGTDLHTDTYIPT